MVKTRRPRGRPNIRITLGRAARLDRLLGLLAGGAVTRDALRADLGIGLRTFYRELDLLRRCGIAVRQESGRYALKSTMAEAEGRLPFPDPLLTFAEMAELAGGQGPAALRLADLLRQVKEWTRPRPGRTRAGRSRGEPT